MFPHLGEEVAELDEQDDADQDADRRYPAVAEHVVGESGRAERDSDRREQPHGLALREAVVDEPVRGVILPALRHRTALDEADDRDERRVENRDREHDQRQKHGRHRGSGRGPAGREADAGEPEAEQLAACVAHEDGGAARPEVAREEADAREPERERERQHEVAVVHGRCVDREVRAGDRRQRRGEAVHVVEEVERIRDPDQPDECDHDGDDVVREQLHLQPGCDHETGRGELREQLDERLQPDDVVDQARDEDDRAAEDDPEQLPRRLEDVEEEREPDAGDEAAEDPDAAKGRRRHSCQRSPVGTATSRLPSDEREERADDEVRRG